MMLTMQAAEYMCRGVAHVVSDSQFIMVVVSGGAVGKAHSRGLVDPKYIGLRGPTVRVIYFVKSAAHTILFDGAWTILVEEGQHAFGRTGWQKKH